MTHNRDPGLLLTRLDGSYGVGPHVWRVTARARRTPERAADREVTVKVHTPTRSRPQARATAMAALELLKYPNHYINSITHTHEGTTP